mmetsp:Transcript_23670/g.68447  ORF Transcript_23670/g.68447 Transcript_23670/m.68447 type:complete len:367 (-) Transcript_23670:1335-2435(-)
MRDAAVLHTLTRGQGLPIWVAALLAHLGAQIHEACGVLVGAEIQDLALALHVTAVDAAVVGHHAVQQSADVLDEARPLRGLGLATAGRLDRCLRLGGLRAGPGVPGGVLGVREDDALRATLGNVLVLHVLRQREVVTLVEQGGSVTLVRRPVPRQHDADTTSGNIPEAHMEAHEGPAADEVDAMGDVRVHGCRPALQHHFRIQTEGHGTWRLRLEKVGEQHALVESEKHFEDLPVLLLDANLIDRGLEVGVEPRLARPGGDASKILVELRRKLPLAAHQLVNAVSAEQVPHAQLVQRLELPLRAREVFQHVVDMHVLGGVLLLREEGVHELDGRRKIQSDLVRNLRLHDAVVQHVPLAELGDPQVR